MAPEVLVTGGAGYIGSHVCKALARAGFVPVSLDNLSTGAHEAVRWGPLEAGDLRDAPWLRRTVARYAPVAVVHLAGVSHVAESVEYPLKYYDNNVVGTVNLLGALAERSPVPVVFSSSCTVYGQADAVRGQTPETAPQAPLAPYGKTKQMVETLLTDSGRAHGLPWMSLRFFNAAGADPGGEAGERPEAGHRLIPNALGAAYGAIKHLSIHGRDYPTGDGTCIRDFVHVSDLADAHVAALQRLLAGAPSAAVNLGSGQGWSVLDIVHRVERITARTVPVQFGPRRKGDAASAVADISLARDILAFRPARSLDDMIADADRWYRRNAAPRLSTGPAP